MPDDPSPPVAIRITRPYATEEEFLDSEVETLTRTTITLVGAQQRPQGVILRFELVLSSGQVLLRGEGRVIAFKPNVVRGLGGLALRFTRLDTRSKALVDRAAAHRERRRSTPNLGNSRALTREASSPEFPRVVSGEFDLGALPSIPPPEDRPREPREERLGNAPTPMSPALVAEGAAPANREPGAQGDRVAKTRAAAAAGTPLEPPREREALLERLRSRARQFDSSQVQLILQSRRRDG